MPADVRVVDWHERHGDAFGRLNREWLKMAVTEPFLGRGIGRDLLCAAIERFHEIGGRTLYLESNSRLGPALALYESAGFRHESPPEASDYARADVYRVFRGEKPT